MAGDWIKMRGNLWDDPRIARICDITGESEATVIGGLYWLWAAADQHTEDGVMQGLSTRGIDRKTGVKGFGDALVEVGWLADHPEGVRIVNFEEHNGTSAKKRCQTAKRVAAHKSANASEEENADEGNAGSVTTALPQRYLEKEKRREEEIEPNGSVASKLPTCQTDAVVQAYHAYLPELPAVRLLNDSRKKAISSFWRWVLTSKKTNGEPRANDAGEALEWIKAYFIRASENDFLMGRHGSNGKHSAWKADFDFLLTEKGKRHVIEKTEVVAANASGFSNPLFAMGVK